MSILKQLFRWQKGRQQSGYDKKLLAGAYWPLKFDCYLLRFAQDCDFICAKPIYQHSRIKFFRPDLCEHAVSKVEQSSRYLLRIGWVKR